MSTFAGMAFFAGALVPLAAAAVGTREQGGNGRSEAVSQAADTVSRSRSPCRQSHPLRRGRIGKV